MSWWKRLANKARDLFGGRPSDGQSSASGECDHGDAIHLRQGTAEFEWFVARGELELGTNLPHGASHLANLLMYDPGNPEWVELLDKYLALAPDPERLIPSGGELYVGTEALRAYIWHSQGRLQEALKLLIEVTHAKPDLRYLEAWTQGWLEPPGVMESLPDEVVILLFTLVLGRYPEARRSPQNRLRELQTWARLSERIASRYANSGMATMVRVGLLRKAGFFDEGTAVIDAAVAHAPDWNSTTAQGLILREHGNIEAAEKAFQRATAIDPGNVSTYLEAGDMFCDIAQWERALKWYEAALAIEPEHRWAKPSTVYCHWKRSSDDSLLRQLVDLAKAGNQRAIQLYNREFFGDLPEPVDATANFVRQIRENILADNDGPKELKSLTLSCLEAPSNFLAFRRQLEAFGHEYRLEVSVAKIPKPDPRWPITKVKYLLWDYEGTEARPGLPPPGEDVAHAIAKLAAEPFDDMINWASASRVAEALGPERVGEVLAIMVHPPALPVETSALVWLPRVQHAAAQVAAQIDSDWEGSARREALYCVLHGPQDWATVAAIRALAQIGASESAHAADIHDAFQTLADHRPDEGFCCWEYELYQNWLRLPHLFDREREDIAKIISNLERQQSE